MARPRTVGGPWGYLEFLEAIADPKHQRQKELMTWSGGALIPKTSTAMRSTARSAGSHLASAHEENKSKTMIN
jgi:hypothetical protein